MKNFYVQVSYTHNGQRVTKTYIELGKNPDSVIKKVKNNVRSMTGVPQSQISARVIRVVG